MKVSSTYNLAVKYPNLVKEWHPTRNETLTPHQVTPGSGKKVWWLCERSHEWRAQILSRTRGAGCPFCSGRFATKDNNLAVVFPQISREWHPRKNALSPDRIKPGSNKKVWWICEQGHEWQAVVSSRRRSGCPICAAANRGKRFRIAVVRKRGSLSEHFPDIAKQWHFTKNLEFTPDTITPGSSKKIWWICDNNHEWQASVVNRTKGRGCPYSRESYILKPPRLA